jgi:hypothetical protein
MKNHISDNIQKILRLRKKLILQGSSKKNHSECLRYIKSLELQIEAYKNTWSLNGWEAFAHRNKEILIFLAPGNQSGAVLLKKLFP